MTTEKKPRLVSEQGGTVSEYAAVRETPAQPESATTTQVEEADPPATAPTVPGIKIIDMSHQHVSRQQKAR